MKYTNKHIKKLYIPYQVLLYLFSVVGGFGIFLLLFAFLATGKQMKRVDPFEDVLTQYANPANKTTYLEIVETPQKITENQYEGYYLVQTESGTYLSGMQEEQYAALKREVEETGNAKLEGMTKVVVDETVLADAAAYLNENPIFIRVTKLSYGGILREGYIVNLILGELLVLVSVLFIVGAASGLRKYKHPNAKQIDEECNRKSAKWLPKCELYLTDHFLVSLHNSITALDIDKVSSVILYATEQGDVIMDAKQTDGSTRTIFKEVSNDVYMYEEDKAYLETVFGNRNIQFLCELEVLEDDGEDDEVLEDDGEDDLE